MFKRIYPVLPQSPLRRKETINEITKRKKHINFRLSSSPDKSEKEKTKEEKRRKENPNKQERV